MAVGIGTKYLINGFPHAGKDESRSDDVSVPNDVMRKLMMPLFKKDRNVTNDNYFTFLNLYLRLAKRGCSLVDATRTNRREIPNNMKETYNLHDIIIVKIVGVVLATVIN